MTFGPVTKAVGSQMTVDVFNVTNTVYQIHRQHFTLVCHFLL